MYFIYNKYKSYTTRPVYLYIMLYYLYTACTAVNWYVSMLSLFDQGSLVNRTCPLYRFITC